MVACYPPAVTGEPVAGRSAEVFRNFSNNVFRRAEQHAPAKRGRAVIVDCVFPPNRPVDQIVVDFVRRGEEEEGKGRDRPPGSIINHTHKQGAFAAEGGERMCFSPDPRALLSGFVCLRLALLAPQSRAVLSIVPRQGTPQLRVIKGLNHGISSFLAGHVSPVWPGPCPGKGASQSSAPKGLLPGIEAMPSHAQ